MWGKTNKKAWSLWYTDVKISLRLDVNIQENLNNKGGIYGYKRKYCF